MVLLVHRKLCIVQDFPRKEEPLGGSFFVGSIDVKIEIPLNPPLQKGEKNQFSPLVKGS
jgi:hypothetical protein